MISLSDIVAEIAAVSPAVEPLIAAVASHPEESFHEFFAADMQEKFLISQGFQVTRPLADLRPALWGEFRAVETPGPTVAILTEFDALPAPLGHACGHPLIMGSGLMALAALRNLMKTHRIPGTLIAACSPGEEQKGGKVKMLEAGLFDKVDAAFCTHPFFRDGVSKYILAVSRFTVEFSGKSSHASTAPEMGVNALDAMHLFLDGINAWRQQLPATARVHGIVTNGGQAPNVIPEYTSGYFYVRSDNNAMQEKMVARFADIAKGAALMTGCRAEVKPVDLAYSAGVSNACLSAKCEELMRNVGMNPLAWVPEPLSTDMANVCDKVPSVNFFFNVTGGKPYPLHSAEFRDAAASKEAIPPTRNAGAVMAAEALEFLTDNSFRQDVEKSFQK